MPRRLLFWFLLLSFGRIVAQSDSLTLVNASWTRDTLDGFVLSTVHFGQQEYFHSNQFISILEIPAESEVSLQFAHAAERTPTTTIARQYNALAAVNGSFFDMDKHHPVCYLRIDGVELGVNTPGRDTVNRKYYQYGALLLHGGRATILQTDSARLWEPPSRLHPIPTHEPPARHSGSCLTTWQWCKAEPDVFRHG